MTVAFITVGLRALLSVFISEMNFCSSPYTKLIDPFVSIVCVCGSCLGFIVFCFYFKTLL